MKKILIAFEGTSFSEGAFEFARQLNNVHPVLLTGVFLPQISYANLISKAEASIVEASLTLLEDDEAEVVNKNINRFRELCQNYNISYRIHDNAEDFALPQLAKETRFADLLVIGGQSFYNDMYLGNSIEYLKEAIHKSECPVVVVPEQFKFPKVNLLAYDGSESALFAIKQFAYLFPELSNQETILAYIAEDEERFPAKARTEELARQHFMDVRFVKIENEEDALERFIKDKKNVFLICGAFGRSAFSEMIRKSFAEPFLENMSIPVFIAHK